MKTEEKLALRKVINYMTLLLCHDREIFTENKKTMFKELIHFLASSPMIEGYGEMNQLLSELQKLAE